MLSPRLVTVIASNTEQFAETCYNHDLGCCQSINSYKVLTVLQDNYTAISPYVTKRQGEVNDFIDRFLEEYR